MIEELRAYLHSTREMQEDGKDPLLLLGIIDSRLIEIANYLMVCHRSLAEHRANSAWSWFGESKRSHQKIERTSGLLNEALEIQQEMVSIRLRVQGALSKQIGDMERLLLMLNEKASGAPAKSTKTQLVDG